MLDAPCITVPGFTIREDPAVRQPVARIAEQIETEHQSFTMVTMKRAKREYRDQQGDVHLEK